MKKAALILIPLVLAGVVAGLGIAGIVRIPGLTPKKAPKVAAQTPTLAASNAPTQTPTIEQPTSPVAPPVPAKKTPKLVKSDPELGADALATVWNEVKVPQLLQMAANWKDEEFAKVLSHMDTSQVAKVLNIMAAGDPENRVKGNPVRASNISRLLRDIGGRSAEDAVKG